MFTAFLDISSALSHPIATTLIATAGGGKENTLLKPLPLRFR
ncbi:MAG: hypothetical protein AAFS04_04900 [Cyanobacteria bacterium J06631_9]